ncbi:MAG: porin [Gammaproteobacteria bacterium]|nr:MAG: porin [Gammaproteobacteria bacterium]
MNRKLLSIAIASLTLAPAAFADVTVYGKANISFQQLEETYTGANLDWTSQDNWEMLSNASRFGIKGSHDISDTLKGIYKLEWEYDTADGLADNDELKARNMYAGLQHKHLGTLVAGKHDTPLKLAQGKVDQFNDLEYGDIKNLMVGENREDNIVMYTTPNFGGFSATVAFMPGEDAGCDDPTNPLACTGAGQEDDGFADQISASVGYTMKDVFAVTVAMDDNVQNADIIRAVGEVYLGPVTLGVLAQEAEVHDDYAAAGIPTQGLGKLDGIAKHLATGNGAFDIASATGVGIWEEQSAMLVSAAIKAGDFTIKGQIGKSETTADSRIDPLGLADFEVEQMAFGVDYTLSKYSKVYAYYAHLEANPDSAVTKLTIKDDEWQTFGVGIEVNF